MEQTDRQMLIPRNAMPRAVRDLANAVKGGKADPPQPGG